MEGLEFLPNHARVLLCIAHGRACGCVTSWHSDRGSWAGTLRGADDDDDVGDVAWEARDHVRSRFGYDDDAGAGDPADDRFQVGVGVPGMGGHHGAKGERCPLVIAEGGAGSRRPCRAECLVEPAHPLGMVIRFT